MDPQSPTAAADPPGARTLDVRWIHGSPSAKHNTDPDIQVHAYDEHTVILRQNMAIDYEAPFMFLLFGQARAVLIDTGATASAAYFPLRRVVDELMAERSAAHPRTGTSCWCCTPIRTAITSPGTPSSRTARHHGGARGPGVRLGLLRIRRRPRPGRPRRSRGRVLECLATPGHHEASVTYYDPWTGLLLTGDTVYPGRLYIEDWSAFGRTVDRLIDFCDSRPVTHVLGCHIEMTRQPGVDYPVRTTYQPDEPHCR